MKSLRLPGIAALLVLSGILFRSTAHARPSGEKPQTVGLPGGTGGIGLDDIQFSATLDRVMVPAGRTGNLLLIDPRSGQITPIPGFSKETAGQGGHGESVTSVAEVGNYLFATDRSSRRLDVVDPRTQRIVAWAGLAAGPDYVRYVAPTQEIWVTQPEKERIEIFTLTGTSPPKPQHSGFVEVKGGPEALVIDAARGRAYSNQWRGKTVAIDLKKRQVVETWSNGCRTSLGLAFDAPHGYLFVGCGEGKAMTLDAAHDGKNLGSASSGSGVDIIDYSPSLHHLYLPGARSATMAVIAVSPTGALNVLGTFPTARGAHCVTADTIGNAWVCDPHGGKMLVLRDPYPPSN